MLMGQLPASRSLSNAALNLSSFSLANSLFYYQIEIRSVEVCTYSLVGFSLDRSGCHSLI